MEIYLYSKSNYQIKCSFISVFITVLTWKKHSTIFCVIRFIYAWLICVPAICETTTKMIKLQIRIPQKLWYKMGLLWYVFGQVREGKGWCTKKSTRAWHNRAVLVIQYSSFLSLKRVGGMTEGRLLIPGCTS